MVIIQDSREQAPLKWNLDEVLTEVRIEALPVGDYAVEFIGGHRPPIAIERKSIGDLFGTMGKGYPRFKREMARAKENGTMLVLAIEGMPVDVIAGTAHSKLGGLSVLRKLMTLWMRYELFPLFCGDKRQMAIVVRELFEAIGRNYVKAKADE